VKGKHSGEALENARRYLFRHTERGQRRYGQCEFELHLHDWFIPALYQNGQDRALLMVETQCIAFLRLEC
jgi:hypothetical protein